MKSCTKNTPRYATRAVLRAQHQQISRAGCQQEFLLQAFDETSSFEQTLSPHSCRDASQFVRTPYTMGNLCSSSGADAASPGRELTALEKLTATKVKEYIAKHRVEASNSLNQIVMKFPAVRSPRLRLTQRESTHTYARALQRSKTEGM